MTPGARTLWITLALTSACSITQAEIVRYHFSGSVSTVIVKDITAPATIAVGTTALGWLDYNTNAHYRFTSGDGYSNFYDDLFPNGQINVGGYQWNFDASAPNAIGMISSFTNNKPMPPVFDFVYLWTALSKQTPFTFGPGAEYGSISISGGTTNQGALASSNVPGALDLLAFAPSFQLMQLNSNTNQQLSVFVNLNSFAANAIPEPSSLAIAALALALSGLAHSRPRSRA